jgi:hypothetical protein
MSKRVYAWYWSKGGRLLKSTSEKPVKTRGKPGNTREYQGI